MANVIDFSDGSEYVIYQNSGKTYIGKFYKISDVEKGHTKKDLRKQ